MRLSPTRKTYEVRWTDRAKRLKPDTALPTTFQQEAGMDAYIEEHFPQAVFGQWVVLTDAHHHLTHTYDREKIVKLDGIKLLARIIESTKRELTKRPEQKTDP